MSADGKTATGRCLCGGVRFAMAETPAISVCHCETCRRWSGAPMMAVHPEGGVDLQADGTLVWYRSSDWAERGFCSACGTSLFYRLAETPSYISVSAGALDDPGTIKAIGNHIFVDEKPAFYDFADAAPRLTGAEAMAEFTGEEQ